MNVLGVVTVPVGDHTVTLPVVSFSYANDDAERRPGGLFVDDAGNLGIAVDGRASMPSIQESVMQSALHVAHALGDVN